MRKLGLIAAAILAVVTALVMVVPSSAVTSGPTLYGCVRTNATGNELREIYNVYQNKQPTCPSGSFLISWQGLTIPSPSPTPTTPSPTPTVTSPSPTPTVTAGSCQVSLGQNCGPYSYGNIPMSNGFDTYVSNQNVGANSGTAQTVNATDPGNWSVTSNALPLGYEGVQTFPDVQQLSNDWNPATKDWSGSNDTPLSSLSALTINYSESQSQRDTNTINEFAPDIWTENYPSDVMFWVDTSGRCNAGAYGGTVLGTANFDGQTWTVNRYGGPGAEIIFVLDADPNTPNSCAQQMSGSVDIKAGFDWLVANGYMTSPVFTQLNTGWEITSSDNTTFTMNSYSITATPN